MQRLIDIHKTGGLMQQAIREGIYQAVEKEPFARELGLRLLDLNLGHSVVEMHYRGKIMDNIYARAHGGALFALIDEAFETACQTHGTIAVALNVNVTYVRSPEKDELLRAEAREVSKTRKTASYDIKVTNSEGLLIATCQALAYRTGKPVPWADD
jgi:acyl-CoA thioesterase